jgi:hypothetical protein
MVNVTQVFEFPDQTPLNFCLWVWMKSEVQKTELNTQDELLARILDAAARIKKREDQLRRTTRDLRTRLANCVEVGGGIFEHLLLTVTSVSFLFKQYPLNIRFKLKVILTKVNSLS